MITLDFGLMNQSIKFEPAQPLWQESILLPTTETLTFEMKGTTILDITIVDENGVKTMLKVKKPKIKGRSKPKKLSFDIVSHSIPLDSKL